MQLDIFQKDVIENNGRISKEQFNAIKSLYVATSSYFKFVASSAKTNIKSFNQDFMFLCDDLISSKDQEALAKNMGSVTSSEDSLEFDFFEDPKNYYYELLISYLKKCSSSKKQLGAFYTPQDVVNALIKTVIEKNDLKTSDLKKKKVLDPTMGGGDWLTAWYENQLIQLSKGKKTVSQIEKEEIFSNTIYGVDIDPVAVLCTRLIFWHYMDYENSSKKVIKRNLVLANTLDIFNNIELKQKKFDVVIGNPPYVVQNLKNIPCYTRNSNNIYAAITEASTELLTNGGFICFVIPLSVTCAKSLAPLRAYIAQNYEEVYYSTYGIRPQKMFNGVDQRITVFMGKRSNIPKDVKFFSFNGHLQWRDRDELVESLKHTGQGCMVPRYDLVSEGWPKISNEIEHRLLNKVRPSSGDSSFYDLLSKEVTAYPVYYYGNARYFIKAIDYIPLYRNNKDPKKENSELKVVYAKDANSQKALISILNSTMFYWMWILYSDCFHMDIKILKYFKVDGAVSSLSKYAPRLVKSMKAYSVEKKHGDNLITEFKVRESLREISLIDVELCRYFKLNKAEEKFIQNYALDLRRGDDLGDNSIEEVAA